MTTDSISGTITLLPAVQAFLSTPKQLLIDGEWVDAKDGTTFATVNPSTEQVLVQVAQASAVDVDRAVVAARTAFESPSPWSAMSPRERSHLLWRIGDLIDEHAEEFAQLESLDNGKRVEAAHGDVATAAELFRYFAGWATKMEGTTIPMSVPGRDFHAYTRREPIGVVAGIVPWNFPLTMACFKIVPAITAGNTVVLKPAEQTPLTALRLGELLLEAGVPAGVVNVVTGFGETGAALVGTPRRRQGRLHRQHRGRQEDRRRGVGQPQEGLARARRQGPQHHLRGRRPRRRDRRAPSWAATSTRASAASTGRASTSSARSSTR